MSFRLGTELTASLNSSKLTTNSAFASLSPQHETTGELSIRQPLLKDFGGKLIRGQIDLTRIRVDSFDLLAWETIERSLAQVAHTYWDLVKLKEEVLLLQKMEEYDGVVILSTNLRKNMDEAFARRMHFTVEFPIPDESDRHRIWQGIFPREAPLARDIDLSFLARQFKITGGNIKNVALSAAFLAAQNGGSVTMENLIRATKREYQKMGKLCTEGDFVQYFELVKN